MVGTCGDMMEPIVVANWLFSAEVNWGPLSLTRVLGMPCLHGIGDGR